MAWAEVGSGSQRATTEGGAFDTLQLAYPGNVTSGNLLSVTGATWTSADSHTVAVSNTRSTSYTVVSPVDGPDKFQDLIAYGFAPSGGACTVTIDPNAAGAYGSFSIDEFSGGDSGTPLDVDGGSSQGTSTSPSDGITTTTDGALILGTMVHAGGTTSITPGANYTQIGEIESASNTPHSGVFRIAGAAGAYTVDWTLGASSAWLVRTIALRAAAGAAAASILWTPARQYLLAR